MRASIEPQPFWCGTQDSYEYVLSCSDKAVAMAAAASDKAPEMPPMWHRVGNVGVVDIQGPLVQGDAGWMRFFGVTGYDNVRQAVVEALVHPDVKSILLNVDSGGGQVAGVSDTAKFLADAGKIKPVTTFSDGTMASAAYWLGSTGSHVTVSDTTVAGSIGVLQVHAERSKQLAQDGITVTVVRAGKYKANTNSMEPLSADGQATLQSQVDHLYKPFLAHVADRRGVSPMEADAKMAQGRVFIGSQNLDVGLVDAVGTYEDALKYAASVAASMKPKQRASVGSASSVIDNSAHLSQGHDMTKPTLPEATLEDTSAVADVAPAEPVAPEATPAPVAAVQTEGALVSFLRDELKLAQADAVAARAESKAATEKADGQAALYAEFESVVRVSVDYMAVALGGAANGAAFTGEALAAEHKRLSAVYSEKFKVGGVAATAPVEGGKPKGETASNPLFAVLARSVPASK